jgi:hypothetical protein
VIGGKLHKAGRGIKIIFQAISASRCLQLTGDEGGQESMVKGSLDQENYDLARNRSSKEEYSSSISTMKILICIMQLENFACLDDFVTTRHV